MNLDPVFIVGAPRSGTSLLYRILQGHTQFKPYNSKEDVEVELTETRIFSDLSRIKTEVALDYMLGNEQLCREFFQRAPKMQSVWKLFLGRKKVERAFSHSETLRQIAWRLQRNHVLVQMFFELAKNARGVERILEKTPSEIFLLPEVKATYKNAKLLYVCRHPVDVYSSYRRRKAATIELDASRESDWLEVPLQSFCDMYAKSVKLAMREQKRNPERFMILKYEDLVGNPESSMLEICEFLNETFEPGLIPEDKSAISEWKVDPHLFGAVQKETKKWEEYVALSEVKDIESTLALSMRELEYPRYS